MAVEVDVNDVNDVNDVHVWQHAMELRGSARDFLRTAPLTARACREAAAERIRREVGKDRDKKTGKKWGKDGEKRPSREKH